MEGIWKSVRGDTLRWQGEAECRQSRGRGKLALGAKILDESLLSLVLLLYKLLRDCPLYFLLFSLSSQESLSMTGKPVLHYFNGRGRMESVRWLLAAAGVEVRCPIVGLVSSFQVIHWVLTWLKVVEIFMFSSKKKWRSTNTL